MSQKWRKFQLGFLSSALVWAAVDALSYFALSGGWGNLLGTAPEATEAIGFPWVVWGEGGPYGGDYFSWLGLIGDVVVTLSVSAAVGLATVWLHKRDLATRPGSLSADDSVESTRQLQFSIRTLLGTTAAVAFVLSMIKTSVQSLSILLLVVYLFGPSLILLAAHLTRRIVPLQRNLIVSVTGALLVVSASMLGEVISGIGDFTRGIMGIYVCWIPQCVLILIIVLVYERVSAMRNDTMSEFWIGGPDAYQKGLQVELHKRLSELKARLEKADTRQEREDLADQIRRLKKEHEEQQGKIDRYIF